MSLLNVLAAVALVWLLLSLWDRVVWITDPAKRTISSAVSLITIVAVIIWAIMTRF